jgi:hypothetical protein
VIPDGDLDQPDISPNGRRTVFSSTATNLLPGHTATNRQVYDVAWVMDEFGSTATFRPTNLASTCYRRQPVTVTFPQKVDQASAESRFGVYTPQGAPVPGTVRWTVANTTCVFTPTNLLNRRVTYRAQVAAGVQKLAGGRFNADSVSFFTTGNQPGVKSWSPTGSAVAPNSRISLRFDRRMNRTSVVRNLRVSPFEHVNFLGEDLSGGDHSFEFGAEDWDEDTTYTVTLGKATQAADGTTLDQVHRWQFTTGSEPAPGGTLTASTTPGGSVQLVLQSRSEASVTVSVMNLAGRTVAVLPEAQIEVGLNTLLWSRRSWAGVRVPAGQYLLRAVLRSGGGKTVVVVTPLRLP